MGEGSQKDEMGQLRLKTVELMQELQKEQMETARLRMELDRKDQTLQGVVGANERLRQEVAEQKTIAKEAKTKLFSLKSELRRTALMLAHLGQ